MSATVTITTAANVDAPPIGAAEVAKSPPVSQTDSSVQRVVPLTSNKRVKSEHLQYEIKTREKMHTQAVAIDDSYGKFARWIAAKLFGKTLFVTHQKPVVTSIEVYETETFETSLTNALRRCYDVPPSVLCAVLYVPEVVQCVQYLSEPENLEFLQYVFQNAISHSPPNFIVKLRGLEECSRLVNGKQHSSAVITQALQSVPFEDVDALVNFLSVVHRYLSFHMAAHRSVEAFKKRRKDARN